MPSQVIWSAGARGFLEQFVDERLVRLLFAAGEAAEACEQARVDADSDQLFGVSGFGAAYAAGAFQFGVGRFRDVREINSAVRNGLCVPCGSLVAR